MGQASLSRMIYSWTGVRILTSDWTRYRDVFDIALVLYYRLPNLPKDLVGEYAEAAFKLCDKLDSVDDMVDGDDDNKDKAKGAMPMPWDAPHIPLLPHLLDCWNNTRTAMDAADKGRLLKDVPFVSELPHEGQCNNHWGDRANKNDQLYKNWQTQLLQALRVAANFESVLQGEESDFTAEDLFLRLFTLLADLETKVRDQCKLGSIPHSVARANPLFGKEELATAALQGKINKTGNTFRKSNHGHGYGQGRGYGKGYQGNRGGYQGYLGYQRGGGYGYQSQGQQGRGSGYGQQGRGAFAWLPHAFARLPHVRLVGWVAWGLLGCHAFAWFARFAWLPRVRLVASRVCSVALPLLQVCSFASCLLVSSTFAHLLCFASGLLPCSWLNMVWGKGVEKQGTWLRQNNNCGADEQNTTSSATWLKNKGHI